MSLTLFFIVLSIGIGYMLYDTFKKSRQNASRPSQSVNNKLKVNYTKDCSILNSLQKQKKQTLKTRTVSINLDFSQQTMDESPSTQDLEIVKEILTCLTQTHRIFLLQKNNGKYGPMFDIIKEIVGSKYCIKYSSDEGAVAVLRQLTAGIHLESNQEVYGRVKQYLNNIWFVGQDPHEQAIRQFKNQVQMLKFLNNMNKTDGIPK